MAATALTVAPPIIVFLLGQRLFLKGQGEGLSGVCRRRMLNRSRQAWRVLDEPLGDIGHVGFETARKGQIEPARPFIRAVFKVMGDASRDEHKGALAGVMPGGVDEEAHRPFEDIEGVVLLVRMGARTLCVGLEPPFRD